MAFRESPFGEIKVPLAATATLAVVVCLTLSIATLVADRRESLRAEAYGPSRQTFDLIQAPVSGVLSAPTGWVRSLGGGIGDYFFAVSENRRLKAENRKLRETRDEVARLKELTLRYEAMLGLKTDPPIEMATGRSVTDSRGPYANARLINTGREAGILVGNPVMSENGLVGMVVGVTNGASRVLMLTDIQSRIPVAVERANAVAILTGDGGPNPKLSYLRSRNALKAGDRVVTSGDGGVFPRGLPIGVVAKGLDGSWRVRLFSDGAPIDYVRVLKFTDFSQSVNMEELAARVTPSEMGGRLPALTPPGGTPPSPVIPPKAGAPATGAAPQAPGAKTVAPAPAVKAPPPQPPAARTPAAKPAVPPR